MWKPNSPRTGLAERLLLDTIDIALHREELLCYLPVKLSRLCRHEAAWSFSCDRRDIAECGALAREARPQIRGRKHGLLDRGNRDQQAHLHPQCKNS